MLQSEEAVSRAEVTPPPPADASPPVTVQTADATASTQIPRLRWRTITAVPIAALVAVGVHFSFSSRESPVDTHSYALLYWEIIGVSIVLAVMQQFSAGLRRWMQHMCPIFTAAMSESFTKTSSCARSEAVGMFCTSTTSCVFCTVMEVMAATP